MANSSFYGNNPTPTEYRDIDQLIADAEAAAAQAESASTGAAGSANASLASANNAAASAAAASASQSAAASSASNAASSATAASTSAGNAATSASNAITAASNAATNAASASSSATAALSSATAASASADEAAISKNAAATSATAAAGSATSASNSATAASGSATGAATSAVQAANSATAAATSETNAAAYELSANNWATKTSGPVAGGEYSAKYNAQLAATSASNAASSATTATTQATTATTKASEAATSATNAASSATTATTKASEAATSATNAATSATTATTKASEASTSATNAATSASSAATQASNAATSATAAAGSATAAANSATAASGSATAAAGSASAAASSASSAAAAQLAAESARDQALTAYDNFDDRYLGPKASDPTTDNDGNPLVGGTLYFNTTTGVMMLYTGSAWVAAYISGAGVLQSANNLSDLANVATARTNLGLGSAATQASSAFAAAVHAHAIADVTGLQTALDGKAASSHTHTASQISDSTTAGRSLLTAADAAAQRTALGLGTAATSASTAFAAATHTHTIADVTGLQTALDGKQVADAELTAISALSTNGLIARTSGTTAAARTLTAGTGISVTNGDGVSGNPTVALANTAVTAGTYTIGTFTVDAQGRLTSASSLGYTPLNKAGDSMTGELITAPIAAAMAQNNTTASFEVKNNGGTGDSNMAMIRFHCTGSYGLKIGLRADGYFGIGGWSNTTWRWYMAPDGTTVSAGNVIAYSDERLKKNWRDLPRNFVEQLANVRMGIYDRTDMELTQVGVSAQSLQAILPEAVSPGIEGQLSVAYGNAALAAAVALAKRVVELEERIAALEGK